MRLLLFMGLFSAAWLALLAGAAVVRRIAEDVRRWRSWRNRMVSIPEGLTFEKWERQGGDSDGIPRTVCHRCDRMWPLCSMVEDQRFDNICPDCMTQRQKKEITDGHA